MTTDNADHLSECLEGLTRLNDIDDSVARSSAECNYEDFEEFTNTVDTEFFEQQHTDILKELKKRAEKVLISEERCDIRKVFDTDNVTPLKFNLFIWYFLENGRKSNSSEESVGNAVYAASTYLAMCAVKGSSSELYQNGLYNQCLKVARNCCHTIRIGELVASKKASVARKKKGEKANETVLEEEGDAEPAGAAIGPPRIPVDSAELFLHHLTTQLFGFLLGNMFSLDAETLLITLEFIEEYGRLDLDSRTSQRSYRANSVHEFRSVEGTTDRYSAFVHVLMESKYQTRRELAYGRLVRPRLALMPYPDDGNKSTSKISTERKRAGDLTVNLVLSRIARNPDAKELKLIEKVLVMVYTQCPDLAEFRTNIAQFIQKILGALPYQYAYDFVQLMNVMFKGRSAGVRSLSNELANVLISGFDFTAADPGPVPDLAQDDGEENDEESEEGGDAEEDPAAVEGADGSEDEDSDDESNKSRRMREKRRREEEKKKKKKGKNTSEVADVDRVDALSVLYNIVYLSCLDKSAAMRLHGSHSLAKILDSETHRNAFQEFCQDINAKLDAKLGEIGENLNESSSPDTSNHEDPSTKSKKPIDLQSCEQNIAEKFQTLTRTNKGEIRIEKDIIYMLVRRLASDDKAPVKKSSSALLKSYLSFCDEEIKFETMLRIIQKLCRDKQVSVRTKTAEAFTELMLRDDIIFKESLGSKWLHSLISMLNDTDNDVTEHARKLIMKVLTPLLDKPSDLTWTLLDTIESVTNHRHYIMTALKGAVRENLVKKSVIDSMKIHIRSRTGKQNGAWMVFSQLCVQFEQNVDFAIDEFYKVDLSEPLNTLQYIIHIIENNIKLISADAKENLIHSLRVTLSDYCLHPSHARSIYHCMGKLLDGIGDRSEHQKLLEDFGEDLIIKCFDTIVQSFDMFKDKDEWKRNAELQERRLCTALNVANEVFSYSPQLIQRHERLAKTLSLIVNSHDPSSTDATTINPDMPSAHHTRPSTQLSQYPQSQEVNGMMAHEGLLFSDNVRAVAVVTLANMIVAHDRLLKLMPSLVKQLQWNHSHQIRSNIVVALGDVCNSFKTDRYAPMLAASLCDPSVLVRRHAINQIARLICNGIFRFNGEIMIRMMMATLDANEDVRSDAKLYISEVLQSEDPNFFKNNFVQYMLALTQARRLIGLGHDEEETRQIDVAIGGGVALARPSRIAIYTFMIESLDDRSKFEVKKSISERIFFPVVNGEYDFTDCNTVCLLDDALLIMASNEMQIKMEVGKDPNENALDEPPPEAVEAATGFMQRVYLENYMKVIVPAMLALREFLSMHRSLLQRKCLVAIRMICTEHKNDIDEILQDNVQLKEEIIFEMQRVAKRTEEAHRILDDYLKRVVEFRRQQKRLSKSPRPTEIVVNQDAPGGDVEMRSPVRRIPVGDVDEMADESVRTPLKIRNPVIDDLKTTGTPLRSRTEEQITPVSRAISQKTLRTIRLSVDALMNGDRETRLNSANLEVANMEEDRSSSSRSTKNIPDKDKTIVEENPMEEDVFEEEEPSPVKEKTRTEERVVAVMEDEIGELGEESDVSAEPAGARERQKRQQDKDTENNESDIRRSKRKTPTYNDDESIDADGKVWKKPKLVPKYPEKEADSSANVTLRRSRRGSRQSEPAVEKPKLRKRKTIGEDEEQEEKEQLAETPSSSENVENTPRGQTPFSFDETKLNGGRQCSTPKPGTDSDGNVTFDADVSEIHPQEYAKQRKSVNQLLQILEDDEDSS